MAYCVVDWTFCVVNSFCAIQSWWRFRYPDEPFPDPWWEHVDVMRTFRKRIKTMMATFEKKYAPDHFYICLDCPRKSIWRTRLDPSYKSNRGDSKISKEGAEVWDRVFQVAAEELASFGVGSKYTVVRGDTAEADDCAAIVCDQICTKDRKIAVISGDSDLYQLETRPGVTVYDVKGKRW